MELRDEMVERPLLLSEQAEEKVGMKEIWKDIDGFQGRYQISNLGNVMSLNYNNTGKSKLLKPMPNQKGYLSVALSKNNHRTMKQIHRLVAEAFIPNPDNLPQVNHIDENPKNNMLSNLEWCDAKYNNNYGNRNNKIQQKISHKTYQYDLDGNLIAVWPSQSEASRQLNISLGNINDVIKGRKKTIHGFIFTDTPIDK